MKFKIYLFSLTLVAMVTQSSMGQSIYSSRGPGLRNYFVSGQSSGMGGVGLALTDPFSVNFANPATLVELPFTFVSGSLLHESNELSSPTQDAAITNTNVAGVQFVVPLTRNRIALGLGVVPYSRIEFSITSDERSQEEKAFTEEIIGDGGVNTAFLSLSVKPFSKLYLGVTGLFHFGVLRNKWQVDFDSANLLDTRDEVSQSFTSGNLRVGFVYKILSSWSIGGTFTPSIKLDANKSVSLRDAITFDDLGDRDIELPTAFGIGTMVNLGERWLLGADYYTERWSDANLQSDGYVNDSQRFGVGVQFSGRKTKPNSYFNRVDYRAGFYYQDLGLEVPVGEPVTEFFGSVGLGLPIKWNAAKINLAFEMGKRGSTPANPFEENIVRFSANVNVGEVWFLRPK